MSTTIDQDRNTSGWPQVLWLAGWLLLATMVVHVVALTATGGAVTGPVSLRKPATFAETSWLLCWSVALTLPWLELGRVRRAVVGGAVAAGIGPAPRMCWPTRGPADPNRPNW